MDNPTTLIVAIMYVTIVATGIINILMTLSDIVGGKRKADSLYTSWIVLLLLAYLSFFWETRAILEVEGWDFLTFVGFIAGPIALLFATNLLLSPEDGDDAAMVNAYYFEQSARFFALLCVVQIWSVGLDLFFDAVEFMTYITILVGILFIVLMISKNPRLHIAGAVTIWLAFVSRTILQAL